MSFYRTGDAEITSGDFPKLADGNYTVRGIKKWISIADKNNPESDPILVEMNGSLVAKFEFKLADSDNQGPAASFTIPELFALVLALGEKLPKIKPEQRNTSNTLILIKDIINKSNNTLKVTSKNGWVRKIGTLQPPANQYTLKFVGTTRPDFSDSIDWQVQAFNGNEQKTLIFNFEICGDVTGKPSIWDGYRFGIFVRNGYTSEVTLTTTVEGEEVNKVVRAVDIGKPLEMRTKAGGIPKDTLRLNNFIRYFCPDVFEYEWKSDPTQSKYGVNELVNPHVVFINEAKNKTALAYCYPSEKGYFTFDLLTNLSEPVSEEVTEEAPMKNLVDLLSAVVDFPFFDEVNIDLGIYKTSEQAKAWAKEHLFGELQAYGRAGISWNPPTPLGSLTAIQIDSLIREVKSQFSSKTSGW